MTAPALPTTRLGQLREKVAAAMGDEIVVHADVVEALEPPCYLLGWGAPWLDYMNGCSYVARPAVICVAGRISAAEGMANLERLLEAATPRLALIGPIERVETPSTLDVANITYLTARIILRTTVNL